MKGKILIIGLAACMVVMAMISCKGVLLAGESTLKPCNVSIPMIETIYAGKESISLAPIFSIYNPNTCAITVEKMDYEVNLKDWYLGGQEMPINVYIPAKGKAIVSGAFAVDWVHMTLWSRQMKGWKLDMGKAMAGVVPVWKSLNGKLFNPKLKEVWAKAPVENPLFNLQGNINIVSATKETLLSKYSSSWKMPDEFKAFK